MSGTTLVRIVRLTFNEDTISEFEELYKEHSPSIAMRKGCLEVDLVTDVRNPYVRATISRWKDEESLNEYRKSELFEVVWPATKKLFASRPEVWSYILPEV